MHTFQPKHSKIKKEDAHKLLEYYNISLVQLPKVQIEDPAVIDLHLEAGDIVKIERKEDGELNVYFRVAA